MARITNLNGTSDATITFICVSWLKHWENFSKQTVTYCCEKNCTGKDLVGTHVQKADSTDKKWYLIPLCKKHNSSKEDIEISDSYKLVSANKKETCEKA